MPDEVTVVVDVAIGLVGVGVGAAAAVARSTQRVTGPVLRLAWRPPLVPRALQPASLAAQLATVGRSERESLRREVELLVDAWTPLIVAGVIERLDLTRLVAEHVDLDAVVATVDLDAAVARVDLDAAVARVDLEAAVRRVDLDAVIATVDLEAAVRRVDLDAVVATVDLDAAVARVDIEAIIDRVDLDAVASRLDVDAVIGRIDLVAIVEEVLDEVDLPAIIRDSTGSMTSETVRGVRMTGVSADDAISRAVDRALFRRRRQLPGVTP